MRTALCLVLLVAASCSRLTVPLGDSAELSLLPPGSFPQPLALSQRVEIRYGEATYFFQTQLEISHDRIVAVGLGPLGGKIFVLEYSASGDLTVEFAGNNTLPLEPRFFVADLQLMFWPEIPLRSALRGAELRSYSSDGGMERVLCGPEGPIIKVFYQGGKPWEGTVVFRHLKRNYEITVSTFGVEALGE